MKISDVSTTEKNTFWKFIVHWDPPCLLICLLSIILNLYNDSNLRISGRYCPQSQRHSCKKFITTDVMPLSLSRLCEYHTRQNGVHVWRTLLPPPSSRYMTALKGSQLLHYILSLLLGFNFCHSKYNGVLFRLYSCFRSPAEHLLSSPCPSLRPSAYTFRIEVTPLEAVRNSYVFISYNR
jgi:hypothetical protein